MQETELYFPIKNLLTQEGFDVYGEVNHVDLTAINDDKLIIVELKTQFCLKLLIQAATRQRMTEYVYIAIPQPTYKKRFGKDFKDKIYLLKRLGLGLIFVNFDKEIAHAEYIFHPQPFSMTLSRQQSQRHLKALKKEIDKRHGDNNIGGTKGKIFTAYREEALIAAYYLSLKPMSTAKELRALTHNEKVATLIRNNHYGWFQRIDKGIYSLDTLGYEALEEYKDYLETLLSDQAYKTIPDIK